METVSVVSTTNRNLNRDRKTFIANTKICLRISTASQFGYVSFGLTFNS